MDLSIFIVAVFGLINDWLEGKTLRQSGPYPELSDSEVLTIEIVGEHLGIDTEEGLHAYFRRHYAEWFPVLRRVHRTTFMRQAANLWTAKQGLQKHLLDRTGFDPKISWNG